MAKQDLEFRMKSVTELCLTCGKRADSKAEKRSNKSPRYCSQYVFYNIDIMSDHRGNKGMYPDKVCGTCFKRWGNANRKVQNSTKYKDVKVKAMEVHSMWGNVRRTLTMEECFVCSQVCQRGRKKKVKKGRPKMLPPGLSFNHW